MITFSNGDRLAVSGFATIRAGRQRGHAALSPYTHMVGHSGVAGGVEPISSGRYAGATGNVVLSGAVDLSQYTLTPGDPVSADIIYLVTFD